MRSVPVLVGSNVEESGVRTKWGKGEERERVDSDEGGVVGAKGKK